MNVSVFRRVTGILVLLGVVLIYLGGTFYAPPDVSPGNVEREDIGALVRVTGELTGVREHDGTRFGTLEGRDGDVALVAFDGELPADASGRYTVTGRVEVYEGEREIVVRDAAPADGEDTPGRSGRFP